MKNIPSKPFAIGIEMERFLAENLEPGDEIVHLGLRCKVLSGPVLGGRGSTYPAYFWLQHGDDRPVTGHVSEMDSREF